MSIEQPRNPHVSTDCVLFGFDGARLHVILIEKNNLPSGVSNTRKYKLPGRLIFTGEDPDDAASDILESYTGITRQKLDQFHTFGAPSRMSNEEDLKWIRHESGMPIDMVITVAYMATIRISTKLRQLSPTYLAKWYPVNELPELAFDNGLIVKTALQTLREQLVNSQDNLFKLLSPKFTIQELRNLHETILGKKLDIRNFHKKVMATPYIVPLEEWETNVTHRAARYYHFDKRKYNSYFR